MLRKGWTMRLDHDFFFCRIVRHQQTRDGDWRGMLRFRKQTKKAYEEMEDDEELGGTYSVFIVYVLPLGIYCVFLTV